MRSPLASVEEALPLRLSIERRRGRDRSRGGLGQTTRVRTRQAGKAQRGWRAGARTRPHLGPAHLPGFVQEGAVIDLRPCDLDQVSSAIRYYSVVLSPHSHSIVLSDDSA